MSAFHGNSLEGSDNPYYAESFCIPAEGVTSILNVLYKQCDWCEDKRRIALRRKFVDAKSSQV